jgi:hypothetical protein
MTSGRGVRPPGGFRTPFSETVCQEKGNRPKSKNIKSLSLKKFSLLNPPLKKGEIGGFALIRLAEIPPAPLYKGGKYYLRTASKYLFATEVTEATELSGA